MLSQHERHYIQQGMAQNVRNDGRTCEHYRPLKLEVGVLNMTSGSARVKLGGTEVVVGVKVDIATPSPDAPDAGLAYYDVEISPLAGPEYLGYAGSELGASLAQRLARSMQAGSDGRGGAVDLTALGIIKGKTCWAMYVDALVIRVDGNVLDAVSIAAKAALADTKLPSISVTEAEGEDDEPELEVDDDPSASVRLETPSVPCIVTVSQAGRSYVVDLCEEEEQCVDASLHIAVTAQGSLRGITKQGSSGIDLGSLQEMLGIAQRVGPKLIQVVDQHIASGAATAQEED
ncbi:hypothetical protein WJX72_001640 [[Myrmecia] bisecta]|uniref:Ribosomal RNA-processing protein 42 n=1 Tax=[Myrmecia] bisecta TaxID=41462 RepID=A0AAW1Q9I5_9CHLO